MELTSNILSVLSLIVTIFFTAQNIFGAQENPSRKYFAYFLSTIGFVILFFLLLDFGYQSILLPTIPIFLGVILSISPLLWMYANDVIGIKKINVKRNFFLPASITITCIILMIVNYSTKGIPGMEWMQSVLLYFVMGSMSVLFIGQSIFDIYRLINLYIGHSKNVSEVFSYKERIDLTWLLYLIFGYLLFVGGLIIVHLIEDQYSGILFNVILLGFVIYSGIQGYRQMRVFSDEKPVISNDNFEKENEEKEVSATEILFDQLSEKILELMNDDKLYLDESLTLHDIARKLNTNGKYISQIVNNRFEKSFVTFVNEYRIEEAKSLLEDGATENYTIESIGYQSGFKSKSAFNNAFKKFTGITPSQFIKSMNQ